VRIESCELLGSGWDYDQAGPGLAVANSADVAITGSQLFGGNGISGFQPPALGGIWEAVHAGNAADVGASSSLAVYETISKGGRGGVWFGGPYGGNGGDGWNQTAGMLFAAGTRFEGGRGADGRDDCFMANGGHGGDGLVAPADSHGLDNVTIAGGGGGACGQGHPGGSGTPGTTTEVLAGTSRVMLLATPARDQTAVPITFQGQPGDMVFLLVTRRTSFDYVPVLRGVVLSPAPYFVRLEMGIGPASGSLESQLAIPDSWAPPSMASTYFVQAVFQDAQGVVTLSNPTNLVVLDHVY
jgi:hypothetical protein